MSNLATVAEILRMLDLAATIAVRAGISIKAYNELREQRGGELTEDDMRAIMKQSQEGIEDARARVNPGEG